MILFMILGIPLFFGLLVVVLRSGGSALLEPDRPIPGLFLRGMLAALPALAVIALLRSLAGISYRPFPLYLLTLYRLHLPELLLALLGGFLFWRTEPRFPDMVFFLAGCYTLFTFADLLGSLGRLDAHHLFLLPLLRMATALFAAGLYASFWEEYGPWRIVRGALLLLVPLAAGFISFLFRVFHRLESVLAAALFLAAALAYMALRARLAGSRTARR